MTETPHREVPPNENVVAAAINLFVQENSDYFRQFTPKELALEVLDIFNNFSEGEKKDYMLTSLPESIVNRWNDKDSVVFKELSRRAREKMMNRVFSWFKGLFNPNRKSGKPDSVVIPVERQVTAQQIQGKGRFEGTTAQVYLDRLRKEKSEKP